MIGGIGVISIVLGGFITTQERSGAVLGPFLMIMGIILVIVALFK